MTDEAGDVTTVNKYDDYGAPGSGNLGRFQFTGQMWLEEAGLYHYKARAYHPALGRFMQADPIGYGDGMNMYAYVGNDPVNARDPSGMVEDEILVKSGTRLPIEPSSPIYVGAGALAHFSGGGFNRGMFGGGAAFYPQAGRNTLPPEDSEDVDRVYSYGVEEIVVTATRPPGDYLDGLVSTGFFSCDGYCAPTIDYRFDDSGLTIVAKRVDTLARLKAKRGYYTGYVDQYALQMRREEEARALCGFSTAVSVVGLAILGIESKSRFKGVRPNPHIALMTATGFFVAAITCPAGGIGTF